MRQMVAEKFEKQRGNLPYILEYVVFIYVMGKSEFLLSMVTFKIYFKVLFMRKPTRFMWKGCSRT